MHFSVFLYDLSLVLGASALATLLCRQFKQPVVIGYIITGFLIGPHFTTGLVRDEETIHILSQLGIIFLLFTLGMEFHLSKLKEVGASALLSTVLELGILVSAGYFVGRAFGWSRLDSIFLGALISISSTTITLKALSDLGRSKDKFAEIIFGILIVEDLLAVVLIAILSGIGSSGLLDLSTAFWEFARLSAFVAISLVLGFLGVPKLIHFTARFRSDEMMVVLALGFCFAFSLLTVKLGYSVALGAFLIGVVIGEAREVAKIRTLLAPIRDMFSAIFFVSVGLLIQPASMVEHTWAIVVLTLVIVVGKILTCGLGTFLAGHTMHESTRVGMGKAQIGEFSFIIAGMGLALGVTSDFLYPIAVSLSVITTLMTPYLIRGTEGAIRIFEKGSPAFILTYLNIYTRWVNGFLESTGNTEDKRVLKRTIGQLMLFFLLIGGGLVVAAFIAQESARVFPVFAAWKISYGTALWILTMLLALPIFAAVIHKLKQLGKMLADLGINDKGFRTGRHDVHGIVANGTVLIGSAMLIAWVAAFSGALLPRNSHLIAVAGLLIAMAFAQRHAFLKLYAGSRDALGAVFSHQDPDTAVGESPRHVGEARLAIWIVGGDDPCAGRLIGETSVRTFSGASIVGIDRDGARIVNPGPEEEIAPGDRLMVMGDDSQLQLAASRLLGPKQASTRH